MNHYPISLNKTEKGNQKINLIDKKKLLFQDISSIQYNSNTPIVKNSSNHNIIIGSPNKVNISKNTHKHAQSGLSQYNYHSGSQKVFDFKENPSVIQTSPQKYDTNPENYQNNCIQRKINQLFLKIDNLNLKYDSHQMQIKHLRKQILKPFEIKKIVQQQVKNVNNKVNNQNLDTIRRQIESVRRQLGITSFKNQIIRKFSDLQIQNKDIITKQTKTLQSEILKASEKILQIQKRELQLMSQNLKQTISKFQQGNLKSLVQLQKSLFTIQSLMNVLSPIPSIKNKYLGKPQFLKYIQKFSVDNGFQQRNITINQMIYKVDNEGYLLDKQNRYLLNYKGLQIKLQREHLVMLNQKKMLKIS